MCLLHVMLVGALRYSSCHGNGMCESAPLQSYATVPMFSMHCVACGLVLLVVALSHKCASRVANLRVQQPIQPHQVIAPALGIARDGFLLRNWYEYLLLEMLDVR